MALRGAPWRSVALGVRRARRSRPRWRSGTVLAVPPLKTFSFKCLSTEHLSTDTLITENLSTEHLSTEIVFAMHKHAEILHKHAFGIFIFFGDYVNRTNTELGLKPNTPKPKRYRNNRIPTPP